MSIWTHVAGIIRVDYMPFETPYYQYEEEIKKYLLAPPYGSEGPLQTDVKVTGHWDKGGGSLSWGVVTMWGDLRSFEDPEPIFEWVKELCAELQMVRSCCVKIECGGDAWLIYNKENHAMPAEIVMVQISKEDEE